MKNIKLGLLALAFAACQQTETGPWADFTKCGSTACVKEAIAVEAALLKDPAGVLAQFQKTYEKGEDHVIGWLYMMRDSVLFNPKYGETMARFERQQKIVAAVKPLESDPKLGEMARTVTGEIESLAIASELEDGPAEVSGEPITGTYGFDLPDDGGSGTLQVRQISLDKFRFKLELVGAKPAHNQGFMEGEGTLAMGVGKFETKEFGGPCSLVFQFGDGVEIKTAAGDPATCGFGNGVVADGEYAREGFADPFLSKSEAKVIANLTGEWQSASDPKYALKIADGRFNDLYEGQEPGVPAPFTYFASCPKDCNPVAATPCLKLFGQDEVCYVVVKADGKTLELSQIGGTGNTNVYKRKK